MLKISFVANTQPQKSIVVNGFGRTNEKSPKSEKLKNVKSGIQIRVGAMEESIFLILDAKEAFNQLRQAFTKAPTLRHFDLKCHIWIETNALDYTIRRVLSQLTSDHLIFNQS